MTLINLKRMNDVYFIDIIMSAVGPASEWLWVIITFLSGQMDDIFLFIFLYERRWLWICSLGSNLRYAHVGSDNGWTLFRRQAIIWTNNGIVYGRSYASFGFHKSLWSAMQNMMTSPNGLILRVTGLLCGEFTGPRWIPRTEASDAELWCFLWSASE